MLSDRADAAASCSVVVPCFPGESVPCLQCVNDAMRACPSVVAARLSPLRVERHHAAAAQLALLFSARASRYVDMPAQHCSEGLHSRVQNCLAGLR